MKHVFILNSFSNKKIDIMINKIKDVCNKLDIDYIVEINNNERSTEDIVKYYKGKKVILLPVGGDGMINRVVNSMDFKKNILGFIPFGTGNDFYKSCLEEFENGINDCDLSRINDKYFINTCCFGIDADIANNGDIIHSKLIPKSQRYNAGLIYTFLKYKNKHMRVYVNGKKYEDDYTTIAICNGKYYGGGYKIGYFSNLCDNYLDLYLIPNLKKREMPGLILGLNKGIQEKDKRIEKLQIRKVLIEGDTDITCNIDGEAYTSRKFDIEVLSKKIKIYFDKTLIDMLL